MTSNEYRVLLRRILEATTMESRRFHRDDRGQFVFIALFGAIAFFILLGLILNNADKLNEKVRMQNAADASALVSAEVIAAGLNSMSDNNVAITETIALKSLIEGMVDASSDPKLVANYYGVYITAGLLKQVPFPIVQQVAMFVYEVYRIAWNYTRYVCQLSDRMESVANALGTQAQLLDMWNSAIPYGYAFMAYQAANDLAEENGAKSARVGNSAIPLLRFPVESFGFDMPIGGGGAGGGMGMDTPIPQRGPASEWESPIVFGSPEPNKDLKSNRRGYFHIYGAGNHPNPDFTEEFYELDKGPFPTYLKEMQNFPWAVPYLDPLSVSAAILGLIGDVIGSIFTGGVDWEPLDMAKGIIGSINTNGNATFADKAEKRLDENIDAMGQGPVMLEPYVDAYKTLGIVAVAYGHPRNAPVVPGDDRDLGIFTRKTNGFVQPIQSTDASGQRLGTTAVASAQVYNPVSWDLFTQYWDYKLTRTKKIPDVFMVNSTVPDNVNVLTVLDAESTLQSMGFGQVQGAIGGIGQNIGLTGSQHAELYH